MNIAGRVRRGGLYGVFRTWVAVWRAPRSDGAPKPVPCVRVTAIPRATPTPRTGRPIERNICEGQRDHDVVSIIRSAPPSKRTRGVMRSWAWPTCGGMLDGSGEPRPKDGNPRTGGGAKALELGQVTWGRNPSQEGGNTKVPSPRHLSVWPGAATTRRRGLRVDEGARAPQEPARAIVLTQVHSGAPGAEVGHDEHARSLISGFAPRSPIPSRAAVLRGGKIPYASLGLQAARAHGRNRTMGAAR
jgi:hypothetical protein